MQEPTCPSECPSARVMVTGLAFELYALHWSGAKGTRIPGLLHAMGNRPGSPAETAPTKTSREPGEGTTRSGCLPIPCGRSG